MKKLLLVVSILSALNYSCSKKDHDTIFDMSQTLSPIQYPIDLNFTLNSSYRIIYDTGALASAQGDDDNKSIELVADCDSNLAGSVNGLHVSVFQSYFIDANSYSGLQITVSEKSSNNSFAFNLIRNNDPNLFTLTFQNGIASFMGSCNSATGTGKYETMRLRTQSLTFSGSIDSVNHTGSISIQGTIFLLSSNH